MTPRDLSATMTRGAHFARDGTIRYLLWRRWGEEGGHVCWIMLNPSTADDQTDDPTVRRCIAFSQGWGYGALAVVNLYPVVTPDPRTMRRWAKWEDNGPDWYARDDIVHNAGVVARAAKKARLVVAAWGNGAPDQAHTDFVIEEIQTGFEPWPDIYCLATTKSGAPIHPLARGRNRVPDATEPQLWRRSSAAMDAVVQPVAPVARTP